MYTKSFIMSKAKEREGGEETKGKERRGEKMREEERRREEKREEGKTPQKKVERSLNISKHSASSSMSIYLHETTYCRPGPNGSREQ